MATKKAKPAADVKCYRLIPEALFEKMMKYVARDIIVELADGTMVIDVADDLVEPFSVEDFEPGRTAPRITGDQLAALLAK